MWSGIAAVGGSILGNVLGQSQAQSFNAKEAAKQRDWQERMSSTQYTRAAQDLEDAGLNRMLAITQPSASVGGGASATTQAQKYGSDASEAASAVSARRQMAQQVKLGEAEERVKIADEKLRNSQKVNVDYDTALKIEQARIARAEASKQEVTKAAYDLASDAVPVVKDYLTKNASNALESLKGAAAAPVDLTKSVGNWLSEKYNSYNKFVGEKLKKRTYEERKADYEQRRK